MDVKQLVDYAEVVIKNIIRRGLRSWLTILGIVIGIAAVVGLISLGQGLEQSVINQFEELGADKIFILGKGGTGTGLDTATFFSKEDAEVVEKSRGVAEVSYFISRSAKIALDEDTRFFFLHGIPLDPDKKKLSEEVITVDIIQGRGLEKGDLFKAVVGNNYVTKPLLGRELRVRDKIEIEDIEFKVVGVMEKIGSAPDDTAVLISDEAFRTVFPSVGDEITIIIARVDIEDDINAVAANIQKDLRRFRGLDERKEDFEVQTPEQLLATFSAVLIIIQAVLGGIAAISLLVGAVGIMNTMYTSVVERTKEIGIMKSIGARNSDISVLFLIESGFIGLIGGVLGLLGGMAFAKAVEFAIINFGGLVFFTTSFPAWLIISSLLFAFVLGTLSGLLPSLQASKLKPVDALRY